MNEEETKVDGGFVVPKSNSNLSDIKYGERTYFMFCGKIATRDYPAKQCKNCNKQITAYYAKNKRSRMGYELVTNFTFRNVKYCHRSSCVKMKKGGRHPEKRELIKVELSHADYIMEKFLGLVQ